MKKLIRGKPFLVKLTYDQESQIKGYHWGWTSDGSQIRVNKKDIVDKRKKK